MARPILAVGPKNVASIKHLIDNDCAIVVDNKDDLIEKLENISTDDLVKLSLNAYNCGKLNHDEKVMKSMLKNDLDIVSKT